MLRLCLLLLSITCKEALHVYRMSRFFCWYPYLLLALFTVFPSVSSIRSHLFLLIVSFLHVVFGYQNLLIFTFSFCVTFLSDTTVLLILSNFCHVLLFVIFGKVSPVSLCQHIVIRLTHCHQRAFIVYMFLPVMLLVDERYMHFLSLKEFIF